MNKSDLLNWLQEENQKWEALLGEIDPTRMDQPGVNDEWSMKDMIAHLTGWNRRLAMRLQAAQRHKPEPADPWPADLQTDDTVNAWIYEAYQDRSVDEVLNETRQINQQILTTIEQLPDDVRIERIEPAYYLVWIGDQRFQAGEFFDHFRDDHEADVRAWLARV